MFQVQTLDGRTVATSDSWHEAASIQTFEQNYWGVQLFIVRSEA